MNYYFIAEKHGAHRLIAVGYAISKKDFDRRIIYDRKLYYIDCCNKDHYKIWKTIYPKV